MLLALPSNISGGALPTPPSGQSRFALVPSGQLGMDETDLPPQGIEGGGNITSTGSAADLNFVNGGFFNGGNVTSSTGWRDALVTGLVNRYVASTLCSWQASGGSIANLIPQLPPDQRIQGSENLTGLMFEKFSNNDVSSAGRGGEYTVQAGFGWTNGVLLWAAAEFGSVLVKPTCPTLVNTAAASSPSSSSGSSSTSGGSSPTGTSKPSGAASLTLGARAWLSVAGAVLLGGVGVLLGL